MAMEGRFHYYEGYSMKEVTFPIRVMYELGIKTLFVSNASGGMNPDFKIGDLMIITDHINFFPEHPLRGKNFPTGPRFPDMHETYDLSLIAEADKIAEEQGISRQGVHDIVKRCDKMLLEYEEKLQLVAKFMKIQKQVQEIVRISEVYEKNGSEDKSEYCRKVRQLSAEILEEL